MSHNQGGYNYYDGRRSIPNNDESLYPSPRIPPCATSNEFYHQSMLNLTYDDDNYDRYVDQERRYFREVGLRNYDRQDPFANVNTSPNVSDFWEENVTADRAQASPSCWDRPYLASNDISVNEPSMKNYNKHLQSPPPTEKGYHTYSPTSVAATPNSFAGPTTGISDAFDALSFAVSEDSGTESYHYGDHENDCKLPSKPPPDRSMDMNGTEMHFKLQKGLSFRIQKQLASKYETQLSLQKETTVQKEASTLKPRPTIEVSPGIFMTLRGSAETWRAIQVDFYIPCTCVICDITIFCIEDADYVLCPQCRVVNPVIGVDDEACNSVGEEGEGGVGLGFTIEDLAKWQEEITVARLHESTGW